MTKDQILAEAMTLPPADREALAEELMLSVGDDDRAAIDAEWLAEARRRDEAYSRGEMSGSPLDDVLARLHARTRK